MRSIEKLLVWWVPLRFLSFLCSSAFSGASQFLFGPARSWAGLTGLSAAEMVFANLADLALAVWLYHEAKRAGSRPWLWALAGFSTGMIAALLWIATRLYANGAAPAPGAADDPA